MSAKISVAMATYNGAKYLKKQLESLSNQSIAPYELVVCDDGSTDKSVEIVREFAITAPFPVRLYLNDENLGYSDNFLKAAGLCVGDWIAFCDQDDYWLPKKIEKISKIIGKNTADDLVLVGHTSLVGDENLEFNGQYVPHFKRDEIKRRASNYAYYCIVGFSSVVKSDIIKIIDHTLRHRYTEDGSHLGHDQWIGMLANAAGSIYCISEPLAIWRRHNLSTTGTPKKESLVAKVMVAGNSLNPEIYFTKSLMTVRAAESFELLSKTTNSVLYAARLSEAVDKLKALSNRHAKRASLYSAKTRSESIIQLVQLIYENSYFGAPMCSLGWRSLIKDAAFAFGVLKAIRLLNQKR